MKERHFRAFNPFANYRAIMYARFLPAQTLQTAKKRLSWRDCLQHWLMCVMEGRL